MRERRRIVHPKGSPFASKKAKTQQHLMGDCDINTIVARAKKGIMPSNVRQSQPSYLDVSETPDSLMDAYERVHRAEDAFMALPAKAREELDNDPRRLPRAGREFFERHGLVKPQPKGIPPEAAPEPAKGAGKTPKGSAPSQPGKASPKAAESTDE